MGKTVATAVDARADFVFVCRDCSEKLGLEQVPGYFRLLEEGGRCPVCGDSWHALPEVPGEPNWVDADAVERKELLRALERYELRSVEPLA